MRKNFHLKNTSLVSCYLMPIVSNRTEIWTKYTSMEKSLEFIQLWIFRRLGRINWKGRVTYITGL